MKYDEAFNKNDAAALAAFYTEDGMLVTPHGTFHGRPSKKIMQNTRSGSGRPPTKSPRSIG